MTRAQLPVTVDVPANQAIHPGLSIDANPLLSFVGLDQKRAETRTIIVESR
jgi:hypothetical protein